MGLINLFFWWGLFAFWVIFKRALLNRCSLDLFFSKHLLIVKILIFWRRMLALLLLIILSELSICFWIAWRGIGLIIHLIFVFRWLLTRWWRWWIRLALASRLALKPIFKIVWLQYYLNFLLSLSCFIFYIIFRLFLILWSLTAFLLLFWRFIFRHCIWLRRRFWTFRRVWLLWARVAWTIALLFSFIRGLNLLLFFASIFFGVLWLFWLLGFLAVFLMPTPRRRTGIF